MSGRENRKRLPADDAPSTSKKKRQQSPELDRELFRNLPDGSQSIRNFLLPANTNSTENAIPPANARNNVVEVGVPMEINQPRRKPRKKNRLKSPVGRVRDPIDLSDLTLRDHNVNYFYQNLRDTAEINQHYNLMKYDTCFVIKHMNESKNATGLLLVFFEGAIANALNLARLKLNNPQKIGMIIYNPNLEQPIVIPHKEIDLGVNTALSILREFAIANQSAKHGSLLDAETTIEIEIKGVDRGRGCKKLANE